MVRLWCRVLDTWCDLVSERDMDYFGCGESCAGCEDSEELEEEEVD